MGALTRGNVPLSGDDFISRKIADREDQNEHVFSALLLIVFRKILNGIRVQHKSVKVAQLSDCAFIWSEDPKQVLNAAIRCMWNTVRNGILCRGGISYGNIIEPNLINNRIGKFILGEAVTKAVDMERAGKGCRIFSDVELPTEMSGKIHPKYDAFVGLKNPTDCSIVDEFRWYTLRNKSKQSSIDARLSDREVAEGLMELASRLLYSPDFGWNASSRAGEIHLASSIETITSNLEHIKGTPQLNFASEYTMGNLNVNRSHDAQKRIFALWKDEISAKS